MSYTFLQEQAEESSAASFADIPASVLSRLNLTAEKSYFNASETKCSQNSQSGTTYGPLTESHGEAGLMSSAVASHVRTLAQRIRTRQGLMGPGAAYGNQWRELLVKWCPATSSWKTHLCLWEEVLPWCLVTLPQWGMMQDGVCWELLIAEPPTGEIDAGLGQNWPTPRASAIAASASMETVSHIKNPRGNLEEIVYTRTWPTPTAHNAKDGNYPAEATLNTPTLTHEAAGGIATPPIYLNPDWVEWLMGWPIGWTDLKPLETAKFQLWQQSHGKD